jgi:hypothetical protein
MNIHIKIKSISESAGRYMKQKVFQNYEHLKCTMPTLGIFTDTMTFLQFMNQKWFTIGVFITVMVLNYDTFRALTRIDIDNEPINQSSHKHKPPAVFLTQRFVR